MRKFVIIGIVFVIVAGAAVFFVMSKKDSVQVAGENQEEVAPNEEALPSVEPDPVFAEPVTYSTLNKQYTYGNFSFKYSEGFKITGNNVEGGEMITAENPKGSGFQIFIIPFDEPGPITPERIWQDIPDLEITDPKNAELDKSKTLVFYSYDDDFGPTFEAWTIYKGKLYQINGPKTAEQLIIETLETWDWK